MLEKKLKPEDNQPYKPYLFPYRVALAGGLLIIGIGFYLYLTHTLAHGFTLPGRHPLSQGSPVSINGLATMAIGLLVCVLPVCELFISKDNWKKK